MGDEISHRHFEADDFSQFRHNLDSETRQLEALFANQRFSPRGDILGFELEACIVDSVGRPAAMNQKLLHVLSNPLVVPELAEFNVELNGSPVSVTGKVFSRLCLLYTSPSPRDS